MTQNNANVERCFARLTTQQKPLLDTIFTDRVARRHAFATLTKNKVTTVYKVNRLAQLEEVARIGWADAKARDHRLVIRGRETSAREYLAQRRSLLGSGTWQFTPASPSGSTARAAYKWKETGQEYSISATGPTVMYQTFIPVWTCHASTSASNQPIATYTPGYRKAQSSELVVLPAGAPILEDLLLTVLLLTAKKNEGLGIESAHTKESLERLIQNDMAGALPEYGLVVMEGHRPLPVGRGAAMRPGHRRANTVDALGALERHLNTAPIGPPGLQPPPYTSTVDVSAFA